MTDYTDHLKTIETILTQIADLLRWLTVHHDHTPPHPDPEFAEDKLQHGFTRSMIDPRFDFLGAPMAKWLTLGCFVLAEQLAEQLGEGDSVDALQSVSALLLTPEGYDYMQLEASLLTESEQDTWTFKPETLFSRLVTLATLIVAEQAQTGYDYVPEELDSAIKLLWQHGAGIQDLWLGESDSLF